MRAAYLGPEGTFSGEAAHKWLRQHGINAELLPARVIPEVFSLVETGQADLGVVPVENSIEGTVNAALDCITKNAGLHIVGEVVLPVDQNLSVHAGCVPIKLEDIKVVYSHPQAFAQCGQYLSRHLSRCELRQTSSTAEAAQIVASIEDGSAACICSSFAARQYGLHIIARGIHDYPNNKTRFFVFAKERLWKRGEIASVRGKTSLVFSLPEDRPGGLYLALKDFADEQVNLTKIESRPAKDELGHYLFYVDCEGWEWEGGVERAISRLKQKAALCRVLGTYPAAFGDEQ